MKVANAIAEVLKREGIDFIVAYPLTAIVEAAAEADIRTIIVRQERTGLHMADAVSRLSSGKRIGVFAMQQGPGAQNAFGGVAQAYAESSPILIFPTGVARQWTNVPPNFSSLLNYRNVTKWCDQMPMPQALPGIMRRAFPQLETGGLARYLSKSHAMFSRKHSMGHWTMNRALQHERHPILVRSIPWPKFSCRPDAP